MANGALLVLVDAGNGPDTLDLSAALSAGLPNSVIAHPATGAPAAVPDVLGFIGRTQKTQEIAGAPTDLPVGYQRIVWNTTTNRPSCWMNRNGTIIDAFDPSTF